MAARTLMTAARKATYDLLEEGPTGRARSRVVSRILITLIVINLIAVALESVPALDAAYGR